jgi:hypothetical protein
MRFELLVMMTCMHLGAFLTGLIVPREGGLAIAMTEKLEDMVTIIFLPLVCISAKCDFFHPADSSLAVLHSFRSLHRSGFVE